jgi:integrase
VRHTITDTGELTEPKTTKSRRLIQLPEFAVKALWAHRKAMLAEGNAASPFVFCDTRGGWLRRQNVLRRSFRPLLKATKVAIAESNDEEAAKFPLIRFHDLRHTAATLMLTSGVHAKVVQEILGHANIAITLDTYSHVLPSMQKDAAAQMNRLLTAKIG